MDKTIVLSTHNKGKLVEFEGLAERLGFRIITRDEAGIPHDFDVVEDGETFEENSRKKAEAISQLTGLAAIADDSGLMVDCLGGQPGVWSARFAGKDCDDERNNDKLLALMEDVPQAERTAQFVSVITLVRPGKKTLTARGVCPGHILTERRGTGGFGYDPLFLPDEAEETFAEISQEDKNKISHRARALAALADLLRGEEEL